MCTNHQKVNDYLESLFKIKKESAVASSLEQKDDVWVKNFNSITNTGYTIQNLPGLLSLVHPDFYSKNGVNFVDNLNWETKPSFSSDILKTDKCSAIKYFKVECIFNGMPDIRGKCHADHVWPNSFGGPSIKENRLLLCKYHNGMKGNSISDFNWGSMPPWLNGYLEKIYRLKS